MVEHLSDEELQRLPRGGHDYRKVYAAYKTAVEHEGAPTVILAKTVKGWTLGADFEARNATHQIKKMTPDQLKVFRDRLYMRRSPTTTLDDGMAPYFHPGSDSPEYEYMMERAGARSTATCPIASSGRRRCSCPRDEIIDQLAAGTGEKVQASTTTAFTRLLRGLLKEPEIGPRVVPIIPDEARTFGMDALFARVQDLRAVRSAVRTRRRRAHALVPRGDERPDSRRGDHRSRRDGSFTAAATSYATWGQPMIPFFIFYSMFGFQRIGDLIWSFGDQRGRGFLLGATAGRTTLSGEGLQHCDGQSQMFALAYPELPCLRPRVRVRSRGHRARRHPPHVRPRTRGLLLLPLGLQRELRATADAGRCRRTASSRTACHLPSAPADG